VSPLLVLFVLAALMFGFLNGFHDSANVVATAIASRAIPPGIALSMSALTNFAGPFLFGVAVATTIGSEVVAPYAITIPVALAALVSAIIWNLVTWRLGIPSSSSHALIGGFVGAAVVGYGLSVIQPEGMVKIIIGLFISPFLGLGLGLLVMAGVLHIGKRLTPRANFFFLHSQWLTTLTLGLSHGTNDGQKTMGIISMGLVAFGILPRFTVPAWVIFASAASIAIGTALGGWRLIRTMGAGFYRVRATHAFASQAGSAAVILGAGIWGAPVSTTQVISSSIVGAGSAERVNKVNWGIVGNIVTAWLITIPTNCLMGAALFMFFSLFNL
jgi:PiT family inorganic phosphate transporter